MDIITTERTTADALSNGTIDDDLEWRFKVTSYCKTLQNQYPEKTQHVLRMKLFTTIGSHAWTIISTAALDQKSVQGRLRTRKLVTHELVSGNI